MAAAAELKCVEQFEGEPLVVVVEFSARLLVQVLESIQDCLKLGLWNAGLLGCLKWQRLHDIGDSLNKPFEWCSMHALSTSFYWAAMVTHFLKQKK